MPNLSFSAVPLTHRPEDGTFDLLKFKHKSSERQRVFAGRKKSFGGVVDSLIALATRTLISNIDGWLAGLCSSTMFHEALGFIETCCV